MNNEYILKSLWGFYNKKKPFKNAREALKGESAVHSAAQLLY